MKKRGRQKGKGRREERGGQGGAVQTGTKLETQCVVIHSWLQLCVRACVCPSGSVDVRVRVNTPQCSHTYFFIF